MIFWLAQSTLGFEKENVIFNWLQMTSFPSNVLVFHINRHTYIEFKETLLMSDMFRNIPWVLQDPIKIKITQTALILFKNERQNQVVFNEFLSLITFKSLLPSKCKRKHSRTNFLFHFELTAYWFKSV